MHLKTQLLRHRAQQAADELAAASQLFELLWLWEHGLVTAREFCDAFGLAAADDADARRSVAEIRDQQIALRKAMREGGRR